MRRCILDHGQGLVRGRQKVEAEGGGRVRTRPHGAGAEQGRPHARVSGGQVRREPSIFRKALLVKQQKKYKVPVAYYKYCELNNLKNGCKFQRVQFEPLNFSELFKNYSENKSVKNLIIPN